MSREEAIEILSDMRAEYNLFGNEEEATRYHVLSWAIQEMKATHTERKVGKWIKHKDRTCWYCSECTTDDYYAYVWDFDTNEYKFQDKYCPNCGARMEGEEDERPNQP